MKDFALTNANGDGVFSRPLDIDYDQAGDFVYVQGQKMLLQNLQKCSMTTYGSSVLNPQYGSAAGGLTGTKADPITMASLIVNEQERLVGRIQAAMAANPGTDSDERIATLDGVFLDRVDGDPRRIMVTTALTTEDATTLSLQASVQAF